MWIELNRTERWTNNNITETSYVTTNQQTSKQERKRIQKQRELTLEKREKMRRSLNNSKSWMHDHWLPTATCMMMTSYPNIQIIAQQKKGEKRGKTLTSTRNPSSHDHRTHNGTDPSSPCNSFMCPSVYEHVAHHYSDKTSCSSRHWHRNSGFLHTN